MKNKVYTTLEGIISIDAAIKAKKRDIHRVYIDVEKYLSRDRKATHFVAMLKRLSIEYELCDRSFIDSLCNGSSHGGFAAKVSERSYDDIHEMLSSLKNGQYLVMLDGVEDPYNFGYSIRNLYAFGCSGFIMPKRNWMEHADVVSRASAGASELCSMAVSDDDEALVETIKKHGVKIVCSALSSTSVSLYNFKPDFPFVLFIGGEKRGISKTFMENANTIVHIPYANENAKYSLPTASCAAIFASHLANK